MVVSLSKAWFCMRLPGVLEAKTITLFFHFEACRPISILRFLTSVGVMGVLFSHKLAMAMPFSTKDYLMSKTGTL